MVQRSDDDPSICKVTYRGRHTCIPPISYKLDHQDPTLSPLSIPEADKTGQMDLKEHTSSPFSFLETPGIMAEENVEAKDTYLDALAEQGIFLDDFDFDLDQGLQEQTSESGLAEIFLAPTSVTVTHSPVVFPLQEMGFDQEFPLDDLEFFSWNETHQKPKKKETFVHIKDGKVFDDIHDLCPSLSRGKPFTIFWVAEIDDGLL